MPESESYRHPVAPGEADKPSAESTLSDTGQPVTVVISRRVIKGKAEQFEALSNEMTQRATVFPGYMGAELFRPASPNDPEYRIIFRFASEAALAQWQSSAERAEMLQQIEPLLVQPSETETRSGIVNWFTLPGYNPVKPPAKYKMTLISWLALYPTVTLVFLLFGSLLNEVPLLLRTLLVTAVVMVLMSYVLMPRFTRWFAFWLYPKHEQGER